MKLCSAEGAHLYIISAYELDGALPSSLSRKQYLIQKAKQRRLHPYPSMSLPKQLIHTLTNAVFQLASQRIQKHIHSSNSTSGNPMIMILISSSASQAHFPSSPAPPSPFPAPRQQVSRGPFTSLPALWQMLRYSSLSVWVPPIPTTQPMYSFI